MEFLGQVNVFHGRVHRGKASVGELTLDYPTRIPEGRRLAKLRFEPAPT